MHLSLVLAFVALSGCAARKADPALARDWQFTPTPAPPATVLPPAPVAPEPLPAAVPQSQPVAIPDKREPVNREIPRTSLIALRDWCRSAGLAAPASTGAESGSVTVSGVGGSMLITPGSSIVRWNGVDVHLGYPAESIQDQVFVQVADARSTLGPLLCSSPRDMSLGTTIVVDPGHGGSDSGTSTAEGLAEKEFTLDWAKRLKSELLKDGWTVYLTHTEDADLALSNRVAFAESIGAGLFLSLHFNSAAPHNAGVETYCLTPAGVPSTLTRGYADELDLTLPNNQHDPTNLRVAVLLHQALVRVNGGRDRGVRRARFPAVLRGQNRPAVLIEGGFLSNTLEAGLIRTGTHRQKLAEAIATALKPFAPAAKAQTSDNNEGATNE